MAKATTNLSQQLAVRFPNEVIVELRRISSESGLSKASIVVDAVSRYITDRQAAAREGLE